VEVTNAADRRVRPGLAVAFYEVVANGRTLLGVARTNRTLAPGARAEVGLAWPGPPRMRAAHVVAVADDDGSGLPPRGEHEECEEATTRRRPSS